MATLDEQVTRLTEAVQMGFSDVGNSLGELKASSADNKDRITKLEEYPPLLYSLKYNTKSTLFTLGSLAVVGLVIFSIVD